MAMADVVEAPPTPEYGGGESGRSSPSPAASPEFEFWMVGKNPSSFPSPALLTADELFSGGVVLPLHTVQVSPLDGDCEGEHGADVNDSDSAALALPEAQGEATQPLAESGIAPTPDLPAVTFKWKDIFKAGGGGEPKDRKKVERRVSSVSGNAELININIWPFSRSRSAGAAGSFSRAKPNPNPIANGHANASIANGHANASIVTAPAAPAPAGRKVSSAPCSRSNSRGESSGPGPVIPAAAAAADAAVAQAGPLPATTSMLRRWVPGQGRNNTGPGATGIRLGRANPVWQLRRNKLQQAAAEQKQAGSKKKAVPAAATSDEEAAPNVSAPTAGCRNNAGCPDGSEEGNPPQGLFGLRTYFSKKVY
ncbi:uncharacterized protein LOC133927511 [Phragmites australis]|uniref:uncharacterized protein LOC133927511 n=1 Tax=Phragmites australis TaxID=29695 RepID=UPI002D78A1CC|nr:uncharacterized protein LOC133927511 [Phragmites australis]